MEQIEMPVNARSKNSIKMLATFCVYDIKYHEIIIISRAKEKL